MASVTAGITVGSVLAKVGKAVGVYLAGKLLDKATGALSGSTRESVVRRIEGQKVNVRSTQAALPVVYGIQRVGLVVNDVRNAASPGTFFSGATGKDVLVKSGAIAIGSEDGSGIQAVDNIRVYDDGNYAITSPASFPSSAVNTNVATPYTNYLKYIIQDGDDAQTLPSDLGTAMGWSADYKARGVAYGAFFCLYNENVWKRGVPQITMDVTGNRVYDPRTSSWIGYNASGASSDNPALCILDYLTSKRYGAGIPYAARDGGTLDFIDEQSFEDAADYCDVLVSTYTAGPQEKRFRMNAVVDTSRVVSANLVEMLATCRGELVWQNGKYRLIIRQAQTAQSFELTEDNIVGSLDWTRQGTSVPNLIEATFPNGSGDDYVADSIQFPPVGTTTYLDEDNGIENRLEIALPYTTSIYQAQRTVETMLKELRADVYVTLTATQAAYTLQVGDVVNVTHSGPQWSQKPFVVRSVALTADGLVGLGLQEYDSTAYTLTTPDQESSDDAIDLPDPQRAFITVGMSGDRFVSQGATTSGGVAAQQWKRRLQFRTGVNTRSVNIVYDFDRPGLAGGAATNFSRNYVLNVTPDTEVTHILQDGASADQIFLARDDNGTTRYDEAISVTITPNDTTGGGGQDGTVVTTQILDLALEDDLGFRVDAEVEVVEANYAEANGDAWFSFTTSIAYFAQGFTMPAGTDRDLASVEVYLQRVGSPTGDVNLYVYDNNATPTPDEPNASVAASTTSVTASSLSASGQVVRLDMDRVSLTAGGSYWVVVEHIDSSGTDYVQIRVDESSPNGSDMTDTATSPEIVSWTVSNATVRQAAGFYVRRFGTQVVPTRQLAPAADKSAKFTWQADGTVALASVTSGGGGGATTLAGLTDTTITTPGAGDFLRYDGSTWLNTTLVAGDIPSLDAAKITTGTFATARIPDLDAAKITTGTFDIGRIPVASIDHDSLLNFVANEHVDHSAVAITGSSGLTGGGDLTASSSITVKYTSGSNLIDSAADNGDVVAADYILYQDLDTGDVRKDTVGALPFTNNTGDVESVANATNGGLTATNSGGPDVTLALAVDDLLDHSGTLAAADRFAVHESGAGTRKIAASSIGLNSFNNNLTLTAADIADGQFATVSGTYTFAGAPVLRLGSNTLQPTLQFWDRDTVGGSYRDVITVPAVEELDIGSAGWAVDILGSSVLVNGAAIGTVTSVSNATNGGITVTNGTTTPTLAVDASNLPNFTASTSMEATDRFVVHEAGQASPTARQIAPADIPLSIFNDNLGFSQNVQGDGISLTTTTGTNDTISVAYAASATNLIGAAQLLVGNAATTDRILVTEGGASAVVRQAEVSQLPFASSTHTHPASDITEGTFGAGAYTFTRTTADTTPTVRIENTSGTTGRVLLTLDGESDELRFENYDTGDWQIVNSQQTNGIRIKDGSGGITFLYNNAEVVAIDSSGGLDTLSGGILTGGTQRIQQDGDLVNIKDITATGAFTTTGVGPHGIGSNGSTNIQLLIDGAFTAIGGASASGIRYNSDITGVAGNTVRLTHFDMSSPTITTQSVDETVDDIASFRIVKPTITNNLFNAGLGEAITSATNGTVTTTGAHGFSTSDIVHINGNTDSNHNGWWTITNTGSNTFTLDEYTGTSSGTGGDAYPASKITKAATLWIPNEPTAGTATGIDEAWGIYAPVSARLGNVTAGLIEPISDSTYALGTAINRWSTVYADSLDVGTFLAGDGAESAPSYAFSDDSNTGMWSPANDTIAFSTGGTERFRVANSTTLSYGQFFVVRPTGQSVMTRFRREDNTDLAWDQRIDNPGGTYEIRSVTDAGATVLNALQLEHATGDLTLKGWIRSEDGSAGSPTYSFSSDSDTGMSVSAQSYIRFSVNSADTFRVYNGSVRSLSGSPAYHWYENDAAFNEKHWRIIASGGSLFFQGREDDGEVFANPTYLRFYRSGTTISYTETFGQWRYADGSAASPAVSFSSDPDTGVYLPVSGSIGFTTASTLRATIGSGQFSFGTDWVDNTSTSVDQFQIGDLSGNWGILGRVGSGGSFYVTAADSNTTKLSRLRLGPTGDLQDTAASTALNWSTTAVTVYKDLLFSGNETQDIGSTTNRVDNLWASYYYVKRADDHPVVQGIRDDGTITNVDHLLRLIAQGDLGSGAASSARIDMTADQTWVQGTARGARITFHTTANDTWASPPERMRIDHNGNVGIGTDNPSTLLEVNAGGAAFELDGPTNGNYMRWRDAGTLRGYLGTANHLVSGASSTNMALRAENNLLFSKGSTEVMRITSNANVLIQRTTETLGGGNGALFQIGAGTGGAGMTIHSSTTGNGDIQFADGTVGDASYRGLIRYAHTSDQMQFWAGASVRASVDSGALRSYQPFRGEDGTNALPTYSFANDTDAGMRLSSTGVVRISAGTDATFLDVDAANSRIYSNRHVRINESTDQLLVLNQANAVGNPYIAWQQAGTRRMYLQYNNSNAHTYLVNENGGTIELQTTADEILTLRVANTTGDPYITLANQDGPKGYWQSFDDGSQMFGTAVANGAIHIRDFGSSFNLATFDHNGSYATSLSAPTGKNDVLRINTVDATGSPYMGFAQAGTTQASIQYFDSGDKLVFNVAGTARDFRFTFDGVEKFVMDSVDTNTGRFSFDASQVYNQEGARITTSGNVTLDWDRYNQVDITNDGTARIVTIDDNSMQDGGHYVLVIDYTAGVITSWTWSATGTLQWQGGSAPTLPTATAGDRTVITFVKTGGITLGFYADAPA